MHRITFNKKFYNLKIYKSTPNPIILPTIQRSNNLTSRSVCSLHNTGNTCSRNTERYCGSPEYPEQMNIDPQMVFHGPEHTLAV